MAQASAHFRRLGRLTTAALRQEDIHFFAQCLGEGRDLLGPHDVKKIWAVVRRALPKFARTTTRHGEVRRSAAPFYS